MKVSRGFTLIEVLVALAILSAGIIGLAQAWSGNFLRIRKTALFNDVSTLLERKMIETEAKYKTKQLQEIPDEDAGEFEGFPQYTWKMKSRDLKLPDLSPLIIGQSDGADETLLSMIKQVSEFLNKAVKEVRITVIAKRGNKTVEFSATEYLVDYSQSFAGAGGDSGGLPIPGAGAPAPAPAVPGGR